RECYRAGGDRGIHGFAEVHLDGGHGGGDADRLGRRDEVDDGGRRTVRTRTRRERGVVVDIHGVSAGGVGVDAIGVGGGGLEGVRGREVQCVGSITAGSAGPGNRPPILAA